MGLAPDELPIACTLGATDFAARAQAIRQPGRDALITAHQSDAAAMLTFTRDPTTRGRLDAFVAEEGVCCAFLTMRVHDAGDTLRLEIDAPADAATALEDMVGLFRARRTGPAPSRTNGMTG